MSLITASTPAERKRGCVFAENFIDDEKVIANGGTITGNPAIDFGATFDGTNDYITYLLAGNEFSTATDISIVLEFPPNFDYDINSNIYLYDSSSFNRYFVLKYNNAGGNVLSVRLGNITIHNVPEADYRDYWLANERNVIVVSGTSGDTSAYLNGNKIMDADKTAWTPKNPTIFTVGSTYDGSSKFDGTIHSLKVFNQILTEQESLDYYNQDVYKYRNTQTLHLPMTMENHDPTNVRTLDVSTTAGHATLGAGDGGVTTPTKSAKKGYSLDGGDYLTGSGAGVFNTAETTIAIMFKPNFATDEDAARYLYDASSGSRYFAFKQNNAANNVLSLRLGGILIANIPEATYSPYWHAGCNNLLVISGTTGDTSVWLNGNYILANGNSAWSGVDPANYWIGSNWGAGDLFDGEIKDFQVWDRALTPLQVQDLTMRLLKQVNKI